MKRLLTLILALLLIPLNTFANFAVPLNATSTSQGTVFPVRVNGTEQGIMAPYFYASSSTGLNTILGNVVIATTSISANVNLDIHDDKNGVTNFQVSNNTDGTAAVARGQVNASTTGVIIFAAAPSYTGISQFAGDAGLYTTTNSGTTGGDLILGASAPTKGILFYTGGRLVANRHMSLDSTGFLGIGTTTMDRFLNIAGTSNTGTSLGTSAVGISLRNNSGETVPGRDSSLTFQGANFSTTGNYAAIDGRVGGSSASGQFGSMIFSTKTLVGDTSLTERMRVTETGLVGIGTTTPAGTLSVGGSAGGSVPVFIVSTSTAAFSTSTALIVDSNGRLGIGANETAPTHSLTVSNISNGIALYNTADQTTNYERGFLSWGSNKFTLGTEKLGSGTSRNMSLSVAGVDRITLDSTAGGFVNEINMGSIGVTTVGNRFVGTLGGSTVTQTFTQFTPTISQSSTAGYTTLVIKPTETTLGTGINNLIQAGTTTNTSLFVVNNKGLVGLGTSSPMAVLSVSNASTTAPNTPLFVIASTTATYATSTLMTVLANGNIGVGTASPLNPLSIINTLNPLPSSVFTNGLSVDGNSLLLQNTTASLGSGSGIGFSLTSSVTSITAGIGGYRTGSNGQGGLYFAYQNSTAGSVNATIGAVLNQNGNMGIGTTSPFAGLSVQTFNSTSTPTFEVATSTGNPVFSILGNGHRVTHGPTPILSSCGITPTMGTNSNDSNGTINVGSGVVTACTMAFASNWADTNYQCLFDDNSVGISSTYSAKGVSSITVNFSASLGGGQVDYICIGTK